MLTRQREVRVIVIEVRVPIVGRVTGLTLVREPGGLVIRLCCAVVIREVTAHARCWQAVVLPRRVTLIARCLHMLTRHREARVVMIESRTPIRRRVTRLTGGREQCHLVIGFGCTVVIREVAAHARCRQAVVLTGCVTMIARCLHVLTRQREPGVVVIEVRVPVVGRVTGLTLVRESGRVVIRFGCTVVIREVTAHASCRQAVVLSGRVTLIAGRLHMLTC